VYDTPKRKQLYAEVQRQIVADLPMVPSLFGAEYAALRASVNGFEWIPTRSRAAAICGRAPEPCWLPKCCALPTRARNLEQLKVAATHRLDTCSCFGFSTLSASPRGSSSPGVRPLP
jgi:hypothetical protein